MSGTVRPLLLGFTFTFTFSEVAECMVINSAYQSIGKPGQRRHYSDWLRVDPFGVQSPEEQEIFLYSIRVQIGSGPNPVSYSTGTGFIFRRESDGVVMLTTHFHLVPT
jgi:hypothetical protein